MYSFGFLAKLAEPLTVPEAHSSDHSKDWKDAMDKEYNSLINNRTWDLLIRRQIDLSSAPNGSFDENTTLMDLYRVLRQDLSLVVSLNKQELILLKFFLMLL